MLLKNNPTFQKLNQLIQLKELKMHLMFAKLKHPKHQLQKIQEQKISKLFALNWKKKNLKIFQQSKNWKEILKKPSQELFHQQHQKKQLWKEI